MALHPRQVFLLIVVSWRLVLGFENQEPYCCYSDKIIETLYVNRVTSENKRIHTPPLSPPFKVGVFVVFYR